MQLTVVHFMLEMQNWVCVLVYRWTKNEKIYKVLGRWAAVRRTSGRGPQCGLRATGLLLAKPQIIFIFS